MTALQHHPPRRFIALLRQRCPRCLHGPVFCGWITTREVCPVCGLRYGREEGYFSGGMDLSFFLAAPVLAFIFLVVYQLSAQALSLIATLLLSYTMFIPCAPLLFRYSRVLWLYLDWQLDPVYETPPIPLLPIVARSWLMPTPLKPWTHDSLFALAQRLATLVDPAFDRTLPRREVESKEDYERAAWGTAHAGLLGERELPRPTETFRRYQAFSAYGLSREQHLTVIQEHDRAETPPRVIIQACTTLDVLEQIDQILVNTYDASPLSAQNDRTT